MEKTYYMIMRPPMPGAMPRDGLLWTKEFDSRQMVQTGQGGPRMGSAGPRMAWGKAVYCRELTAEEMDDYEMMPAVES